MADPSLEDLLTAFGLELERLDFGVGDVPSRGRAAAWFDDHAERLRSVVCPRAKSLGSDPATAAAALADLIAP